MKVQVTHPKGFHLSTHPPPPPAATRGWQSGCRDTALLLAQSEAGICGVATPAGGHVGRTPRVARASVLPASGAEGDSALGAATRLSRCLTGRRIPRSQSWASRRVRRFECPFFIPGETKARKNCSALPLTDCPCVGQRADAAPELKWCLCRLLCWGINKPATKWPRASSPRCSPSARGGRRRCLGTSSQGWHPKSHFPFFFYRWLHLCNGLRP